MFALLALVACSSDPAQGRRDDRRALSWTDVAIEGSPNAWRFTVSVPRVVHTNVTCTHAEDPDEVHTVDGVAAVVQDITLYGLLADADYDCVLTAGGHAEERRVHTEPLPDWVPDFDVVTTGRDVGGYTLFNHGRDRASNRQAKLLIVDPDGRVRWAYRPPDGDVGDLDAMFVGNSCILYGGGYGTAPTIVRMDGTIELEAAAPTTGLSWHHEVVRLDSWDVLALADARNTDTDGEEFYGFQIERLEPSLAFPLWTWNSQEGYDAGWLPEPSDGLDAYHANAVGERDDGGVFVSLRTLSRIVELDPVTGELRWTLGAGGDFALLDEDGAPLGDPSWFWGQHAPKFRDDPADGLPRVLLHDNGWSRPGRQQSRALELELDEVARTARVIWEFTEDDWYEPIWGDTDWLSAGHVLVTRGHCDRCQGARDGLRTEILEVDQATNDVVWRLTMGDASDTGFHADRVDACVMFSNRKYCPDFW